MDGDRVIYGLVGVVVGGVLTFLIRLYLDARTQRESERRLGYVHLIHVSEVLASGAVFNALGKKLMPAGVAATILKSADGKFGTTHAMCAAVAELMPRLVAEGTAIQQMPRMIESLLDSSDFDTKPEQLAKLPRSVAFSYRQYQNQYAMARHIARMWADYFSNKDRAWMSADAVHGHWLALLELMRTSEELVAALVANGAATKDEASQLRGDVQRDIARRVIGSLEDKGRVAAASEVVQRLAAVRPGEAEPPAASGPAESHARPDL